MCDECCNHNHGLDHNSLDKNKTVITNMVAALVIKGAALLVAFYSTRAYIKYFDNELVFGIWFTILSILSWILSFDLGIGNGLRNKLVFAIKNNDRVAIKKYITSAFISIGGVALGLLVVGCLVIPFVPWDTLFNAGNVVSNKILVIAMLICFSGVMLQMVCNIVSSIYYALQLAAVNHLLTLITSVAELICVLTIKADTLGDKLIAMSIAYVGCVIIPLIIAGIVIFAVKFRDCLPSIKCFSKEHAKQVITIGGLFFYCQFAHLLICPINQFLITSLYSPEYVEEFKIYHQLFTFVPVLVAIGITPLWSMVTRALADGDYNWMKKIFTKLEIILAVVAVVQIITVFICQPIINAWLKDDAIKVNLLYAAIFGGIGLIETYTSIVNTFANGVGHLKTQAILMTCIVVLKYILTFSLRNVFPWIVILAINVVLFSVYCIIMHVRVRTYIAKKDKDINEPFEI